MGDIPSIAVKVIGIGGGGTHTVSMLSPHMDRAHFATVNMDAKLIENSKARENVLIGKSLARGMSSGGDPKLGKAAALADTDAIRALVGGMDLIFICVSLGGGSGSGAAPVVAQIAKESGAKIIAFCAMPFELEGRERTANARHAFERMRKYCDAAIELPNDLMLDSEANINDALKAANSYLAGAIAVICEMIFTSGIIRMDFAKLKRLLNSQAENRALFAYSLAKGANFAQNALESLFKCPTLKAASAPRKTSSLIINVRCGADFPMNALKELLINVASNFCGGEEVLFGAIVDENFSNKIEIMALGLEASPVPDEFKDDKNSQLELSSSILSGKTKSRAPKRASFSNSAQIKPKEDIQTSFEFMDLSRQRGFFESTPQNICKGQDLDVPTFMRKNIKILVKKI